MGGGGRGVVREGAGAGPRRHPLSLLETPNLIQMDT